MGNLLLMEAAGASAPGAETSALLREVFGHWGQQMRAPSSSLRMVWSPQRLITLISGDRLPETWPRGLFQLQRSTPRTRMLAKGRANGFAIADMLRKPAAGLLTPSFEKAEFGRQASEILAIDATDHLSTSLALEMHVASCADLLPQVNNWFSLLLSLSGVPSRWARPLCFALLEMLRNGMEHGNDFDPHKFVRLQSLVSPDVFVFCLHDEGQGFDLDRLSDPLADPSLMLSERKRAGRRPGGFGIAMTRRIMSRMVYSQGGSEVWIRKEFG